MRDPIQTLSYFLRPILSERDDEHEHSSRRKTFVVPICTIIGLFGLRGGPVFAAALG